MAADKDPIEKIITKYRELVGLVIILVFSVFTFLSAMGSFSRRDMDAGFVMLIVCGITIFLAIKLLKKINEKRRSK